MSLGRAQRLVLALVCAVAVATIYAIQPVLDVAGAELGVPAASLGGLVAAGQVGYLVGLVLLVPLGDVVDRRRLLVVHLVAVGVGAAAVAAAPTGALAATALAVAGLFAVVVQTAVAYVAAASTPSRRGRDIGVVTSGVVLGILGVRVAAGALGDALSWRVVYLALAVACVVLASAARRMLPAETRSAGPGYRAVLTSLGRLVVTDRLLGAKGLIALFVFASFGTLWSGLVLPLGADPWHLSTTQVGYFAIAGLAGAFGASRAGRWADSGRAAAVTGGSLALLAASWLLIAQIRSTLWFLVLGVVLLDFAVQAVHVSNQHVLTAAHPERSSAVIGAYMAFYSLGSALGAVTTAWAYARWGWWASCLLGATYAIAGLVTWAATRSRLPEASARGGKSNGERRQEDPRPLSTRPS